jgi:hypothetical protein
MDDADRYFAEQKKAEQELAEEEGTLGHLQAQVRRLKEDRAKATQAAAVKIKEQEVAFQQMMQAQAQQQQRQMMQFMWMMNSGGGGMGNMGGNMGGGMGNMGGCMGGGMGGGMGGMGDMPAGLAGGATPGANPQSDPVVPSSATAAGGENQTGSGTSASSSSSASSSQSTIRGNTDQKDALRALQKRRDSASERTATHSSSARKSAASRKEVEQGNLDMSKGIDLCFLMDCTGSMGPYVKEAKAKLIEIRENARTQAPGCNLRVAFVGYRDIRDAKRFEVFDFYDADRFGDLEVAIKDVEAVTREKKPDGPEDVAGGLAQCANLSWRYRTRLLVHVADAPCHGTKYHPWRGAYKDNFPDGCPDGRVPEDVLCDLMSRKNLDYYFLKCNDHTDKMTEAFKGAVDHIPNRVFKVQDMSGELGASLLTKIVADSIADSLREQLVMSAHAAHAQEESDDEDGPGF